MNYITMYYMLFTLMLIILGLVFKKSKFLFFIQCIWMWILQALNTGGVDYYINEDIFNNVRITGNILNGDVSLYNIICYYFRNNGYSYVFMNSILVTISLFLIFITIIRYTKNICFVTSLLFIYPFIDNVIQKRFFLASSIIIFAIPYLFKDTKKDTIKYIILCFLAAQFHVSVYVFLLFIFIKNISYRMVLRIIPILVVLAFILKPILPQIALLIFPASKVNLYFSILSIPIIDSIFWICFHIGFVLLLFGIKETNDNYKYLVNIKKIALLSLVFLPLLLYEPTFIRIYRSLLVFNYIALANIQKNDLNIYKKTFINTSINVGYLIFTFIIVYHITSVGFNNMVIPIFENNLILNYLF